jgi:hypothetical protein
MIANVHVVCACVCMCVIGGDVMMKANDDKDIADKTDTRQRAATTVTPPLASLSHTGVCVCVCVCVRVCVDSMCTAVPADSNNTGTNAMLSVDDARPLSPATKTLSKSASSSTSLAHANETETTDSLVEVVLKLKRKVVR